MNNLVAALIAQGMKNNADFTNGLIEIQKRVDNTKEIQAIESVQNVQRGMQDVDMFTLDMNTGLDARVTALEETVNGGKTSL